MRLTNLMWQLCDSYCERLCPSAADQHQLHMSSSDEQQKPKVLVRADVHTTPVRTIAVGYQAEFGLNQLI